MISATEKSSKMASTLCQNGYKKNPVLKKLTISCSLDHKILFKFHYYMVQTFLKECMEWLLISSVSISNGSTKSFNSKFTAKFDLSVRAFYVTIADADIGSLKSLHKFIDISIWTTCWWNLKKIVWSKPYKNSVLFDKKWSTILTNADAILEDVSVTKTII